jgi:hypothetical protein
MALGLVGRQQIWPCLPTDDSRQFPGQILRALNSGIEAQAFVGRHGMGGIANQEDPRLLELLGYVLGWLPVHNIEDLDRHPGQSNGLLDQVLTAFGCVLLIGLSFRRQIVVSTAAEN